MKHDEQVINCLIRHCRMYLYGANGNPEPLHNEVARDFFTFAFLHLTSTMFITTDQKGQPGGLFHRLLNPMNLGTLLTPIDLILERPLGKTTLKQFIRTKRNKLATHGTLAFSTQPKEVQAVTFDDSTLQQYHDAMSDLATAILRVLTELEKLEKKSRTIDSVVHAQRLIARG